MEVGGQSNDLRASVISSLLAKAPRRWFANACVFFFCSFFRVFFPSVFCSVILLAVLVILITVFDLCLHVFGYLWSFKLSSLFFHPNFISLSFLPQSVTKPGLFPLVLLIFLSQYHTLHMHSIVSIYLSSSFTFSLYFISPIWILPSLFLGPQKYVL